MSELWPALSALHFLRPGWLLLLPVIALAWWLPRRRQRGAAASAAGMAPHLVRALRVGGGRRQWLRPVDGMAALMLCLALGSAGPSWSRVPDPLMAATAPLVIVLKVTDSMAGTDLAPSRLERAKHKIRDLLETRDGGRTALVAYAGSAHRVVPLTDDPALLRPYVEGLNPDVMPEEGDNAAAALALAESLLADGQNPGGILFLLDGLSSADTAAFANRDGADSLAFLLMIPRSESAPLVEAVPAARAEYATADRADIQRLRRHLDAAFQRALLQDERQQWEDRGWWLAWPAALLALLWFRRGWTLPRTSPLLLLVFIVALPEPARAAGWRDWFLTPDQQGQWLMARKDYSAAADAFSDARHKGYALYLAGRYEESAEVLAPVAGADAAFTRGMAQIKSRQYRPAIASFEKVLALDPDYPGGARNLALARYILDHVETAREQSDTGEERGIGADDEVLDNQAERGEETEIRGDGAPVSAEQWMSTIDTRTSDFLRQRFAAEARETE